MSQSEIQGADSIAAGLRRVGRQLAEVRPSEAYRIMLAAAQSRAPVRTGALRASGVALDGSVAFLVDYASPVHWGTSTMPGRPFLIDGLNATQLEWLNVFSDDVQGLLDEIKGA